MIFDAINLVLIDVYFTITFVGVQQFRTWQLVL